MGMVEDWKLIHRNSTHTDSGEQAQSREASTIATTTNKNHSDRINITTMPSVFSNPWRQALFLPFRGHTPTDSYLSQLYHWSPWWRVFWHLVWSRIHARELHVALIRLELFPAPLRCLTRDAALHLEFFGST
jgi:hypothetical protein